MNLQEKSENIIQKCPSEEQVIDDIRASTEQEIKHIEEDMHEVLRKNRLRWWKVGIICIILILLAVGRNVYLYTELSRQCEAKIEAYQKSLEEYRASQDR